MAKIYCFVNSGAGTNWQFVLSVCECGATLAEHISSSENWAKHDIGLTSDWKHEHYQQHSTEKHQCEPFELEWVDDPANHQALRALDERLGQEKGA